MHLLEVNNLEVQLKTESGVVKAVDGVSYYIDMHEVVGLVGESGCGKSVSQLAVMQLIRTPPGKITNGEVLLEGKNILEYAANGPEMRSVRGAKIAMVFQEPMTSLNPVLTIGRQMTEMLELHLNMNNKEALDMSAELLNLVGIADAQNRLQNYPHQFSGGMRQRMMIAIALSCNPRIIIADEPTTALDVTTQAQLFEIITNMIEKFNTSLVIVTHNLGIIARHASRIYVMYAGRIVESGTSDDIFNNPCHPYTIGLLKSVPRLDEAKGKKLVPIEGLPPGLINMPETCAFLPRCVYSLDRCCKEPWPTLKLSYNQHYYACLRELRK